jgi:pantothenate synthetase
MEIEEWPRASPAPLPKTQNGFEPEYIILANADNLDILTDFDESKKMVVLIATFLDGVRLIDNYRIN